MALSIITSQGSSASGWGISWWENVPRSPRQGRVLDMEMDKGYFSQRRHWLGDDLCKRSSPQYLLLAIPTVRKGGFNRCHG
jgi:hypothetical protein